MLGNFNYCVIHSQTGKPLNVVSVCVSYMVEVFNVGPPIYAENDLNQDAIASDSCRSLCLEKICSRLLRSRLMMMVIMMMMTMMIVGSTFVAMCNCDYHIHTTCTNSLFCVILFYSKLFCKVEVRDELHRTKHLDHSPYTTALKTERNAKG